MKRSASRILTTHTGSLPRSPELQELLRQREEQQDFFEGTFQASVGEAVAGIVDCQQSTGIAFHNRTWICRADYP
ncbi:MAG: hypothetical protein OXE17_07845 [Chloroflexi bacterium]|nr:hypothetical protein [Chloroflexota bacterium]